MSSELIPVVEVLLWVVKGYLIAGLVFALVFVAVLVHRVDPAARGGSIGFRILILPGVSLLWPLFVWRLLRGKQAPVERTAHREASERGEGAP